MNKKFVFRPNCEICGSNKKEILLSREFTDSSVWDFLETYYEGRINKEDLRDAKYEIHKCSKCSFVWQAYILNPEFMDKLYSTWISSEQSLNKKKYADISFYLQYAGQVHAISSLLKDKPGNLNVLDFGMGWGYWCLMAKAFGYKISGFEASSERIEFAKENGIQILDFEKLNENKFDFINVNQVLEHIDNPAQTLKTLTYSLNTGGIIYIAVPNGKDVEKKVKRPKWKATKNIIHPLEHINCFNHKNLVQMAKEVGLALIAQPPTNCINGNLKSFIKENLKRYSKQFGTSLYFKKI